MKVGQRWPEERRGEIEQKSLVSVPEARRRKEAPAGRARTYLYSGTARALSPCESRVSAVSQPLSGPGAAAAAARHYTLCAQQGLTTLPTATWDGRLAPVQLPVDRRCAPPGCPGGSCFRFGTIRVSPHPARVHTAAGNPRALCLSLRRVLRTTSQRHLACCRLRGLGPRTPQARVGWCCQWLVRVACLC